MRTVLKFALGIVAVFVAVILALFFSTGGDHRVAALVTEDSSLPSRDIAGVRLHMRIKDGPPAAPTIVVLHGGAGGDFRSLLALSALTDTHRVVFYDQRGAGLSERVPAKHLSLHGYLEELETIIALTSPGRPVVLIGHSWGAMLASAYLGAHPDRVDKAILIEPGYLDADGKSDWLAQSERYMSGAAYLWQAVLSGFRAAHVNGPDAHARDDFLIGKMVKVFASHPQNPYHCGKGYSSPNWRFGSLANRLWQNAPKAELDRIAQGSGYGGPVLLLAGACNDWTGAPLQSRHAARFARARLQVIPEAGHDVLWDNPSAALSAIRTFLNSAS